MVQPFLPPDSVRRTSRALNKWIRDHQHVNWALIDQGMVSVINFLTGILLARYLGLAEFGVFTLAWIAVEFVIGIQQSLIVAPMMSIAPKQPVEAHPGYFGAIFAQQLGYAVLSFIICILGLLFVNALKPDWGLDGIGPALAAAMLAAQVQNFLRRYFFTLGRATTAFWLDFVRYGGQIGLLLWLFHSLEIDAKWTLWVISGTATASVLIGCFFLDRIAFDAGVAKSIFHRHWRFSRWLLYSEVVRWGTTNLFMIAAGSIIGPAAVGAIRATQNLVGLCHVLYLGLDNIAPISASRHFSEGGLAALIRYLKRLTWVLVAVVGMTVLIAAAVPELWLGLIYGENYAGQGYLIRWWAITYLVAMISVPLGYGLRATEYTKPFFWANVVLAVFTVATVYPLTRYLGVDGVMIGLFCLSSIKAFILSWSFLAWIRKTSPPV